MKVRANSGDTKYFQPLPVTKGLSASPPPDFGEITTQSNANLYGPGQTHLLCCAPAMRRFAMHSNGRRGRGGCSTGNRVMRVMRDVNICNQHDGTIMYVHTCACVAGIALAKMSLEKSRPCGNDSPALCVKFNWAWGSGVGNIDVDRVQRSSRSRFCPLWFLFPPRCPSPPPRCRHGV